MTTTSPDVADQFAALAQRCAAEIPADSTAAIASHASLHGTRLKLAIIDELREPFARLHEQEAARQPGAFATPVTPEAAALVAQFTPAFARLAKRVAASIAEREDQAGLRVACLSLLSDVLASTLFGLPADAMVLCDIQAPQA